MQHHNKSACNGLHGRPSRSACTLQVGGHATEPRMSRTCQSLTCPTILERSAAELHRPGHCHSRCLVPLPMSETTERQAHSGFTYTEARTRNRRRHIPRWLSACSAYTEYGFMCVSLVDLRDSGALSDSRFTVTGCSSVCVVLRAWDVSDDRTFASTRVYVAPRGRAMRTFDVQ